MCSILTEAVSKHHSIYDVDASPTIEIYAVGIKNKKLLMIAIVVPSRIELEYQVPETCVLSIVLRDQFDLRF